MTYLTPTLDLQIMATGFIMLGVYFQFRKQQRWAAFCNTTFLGLLLIRFLIDKTVPPQAYWPFTLFFAAAFVLNATSFVQMLRKPPQVCAASVALDKRLITFISVIGIAILALFLLSFVGTR